MASPSEQSAPQKRKASTSPRDVSISPPPLRRKLDHSTPHHMNANTFKSRKEQWDAFISHRPLPLECHDINSSSGQFRIISWNVNGIKHLLPRSQKSITSFLSNSSPRMLKGEMSPHGEGRFGAAEAALQASPEHSPLRTFLKRHNFPSMLCLQEVQLAPSDSVSRVALEKAANPLQKPGDAVLKEVSLEPEYKLFWSLPRDRFNARGLGGRQRLYGVCTLIRCDLLESDGGVRLGHVETKDVPWDTEGRVLCSVFTTHSSAPPSFSSASLSLVEERSDTEPEGERGAQNLVVINGYWPNGTIHPWKDSITGNIIGTRHDAKRFFHDRMLEEARVSQAQGYHVILIGDMNVALTPLDGFPHQRMGREHVKNREHFHENFLDESNKRGFRGVDSFRFVNGSLPGFSYHGEEAEEWGKSCDRVDLGIVSRSLVESKVNRENKRVRLRLLGAEIYETVLERAGSDHVPISLDLGVEMSHL